jgi:hypothetical protein
MNLLLKILVLLWSFTTLSSYPYSENGDGSITDTFSGLVWQKCMQGKNNDSTCSGTATSTTWSLALLYCKNLNIGGRAWRLPNFNEINTLYNPDIDAIFFPNSGSSWTSTTVSRTSAFVSGNSFIYQNKLYSYGVRCVSGP